MVIGLECQYYTVSIAVGWFYYPSAFIHSSPWARSLLEAAKDEVGHTEWAQCTELQSTTAHTCKGRTTAVATDTGYNLSWKNSNNKKACRYLRYT